MHTARLCGDHADGPAQLAGERSGAGSLGSALVVGPKHELDLGRQYDPLEKKKGMQYPGAALARWPLTNGSLLPVVCERNY
jgi:hypothetical protein